MLAIYCCTQSLALSLVNIQSETPLEKTNCFLFMIPCGSGNSAEEEVERLQVLAGLKDTKRMEEPWPCKYSRAKAFMNSYILWQHAQDLHKSGPDGAPVLKEEVDTGSHPKHSQILTYKNIQTMVYISFHEGK